MAKRKDNDTVGPQPQTVLTDLGPMLPPIGNADYVELAELLAALLREEFTTNEQSDDSPFVGSHIPQNNDLLSVPMLIGLLADLPMRNLLLESMELTPLVQALLPADSFDIPQIMAGNLPEVELSMIGALYKQSVLHDSKAACEIADRVLYRLAVVRQNPLLLPKLVSRFEELYLLEAHGHRSLRSSVFDVADARLKLLQLQNGAHASSVLYAPLNNTNHHGQSLPDELFDLAIEAKQSVQQKLAVWIALKKDTIAEFWPGIIAKWNEDDQTNDRFGTSSFKSKAAANTRTRNMTSRSMELAQLLKDLRRLHEHHSNMSRDDMEEGINSGADLKDNIDDVKDEQTIQQLGSPDDVEHIPADMVVPVSQQTNQQPYSAPKSEQSLVVFPQIKRTNNRELDERLKVFREEFSEQPLSLHQTPDLAPVRTKLIEMLPHLAYAIDRILDAMAHHPFTKIPPVLLLGPPGSGKTTLAQELVGLLALPSIRFDAAGVCDANFLGVDMRWSTGTPGLHLDLITEHRIANPIIIVDELEKMGGSHRNGDARKALTGLLEPKSAASFYDPYLNKPLNLSALNWLFTANTIKDIPAPVQNRLEIIRCPSPTRANLEQLAPQLLKAIYDKRGLRPEWYYTLTTDEVMSLHRYWRGGSIRNLKRFVGAVVDAREKFMARA